MKTLDVMQRFRNWLAQSCFHLTRIHFNSIFRHDIAQNDKAIRKELALLEVGIKF